MTGTPASSSARAVFAATGADAIMIGRAAQGRPWLFGEIAHHLATGGTLPAPTVAEARGLVALHLRDHYEFYGEALGVRIARKHLGWYTAGLPGERALRDIVNETTCAVAQMAAVDAFFDAQAELGERLAYGESPRAAKHRAHDAPASAAVCTTLRAPQLDRAAARPRAGEALAA